MTSEVRRLTSLLPLPAAHSPLPLRRPCGPWTQRRAQLGLAVLHAQRQHRLPRAPPHPICPDFLGCARWEVYCRSIHPLRCVLYCLVLSSQSVTSEQCSMQGSLRGRLKLSAQTQQQSPELSTNNPPEPPTRARRQGIPGVSDIIYPRLDARLD